MNRTPVAQLNVRIPRDILEELRTHAAMAEKPVSAVVLEAIRETLEEGASEPAVGTATASQQPSPERKPPTIPHQPQARQLAQRPRRGIPIAILTVILTIAGVAGLMYWIATDTLAGPAAWLRSAAILVIVEQANATEEILAVGSGGLRSCFESL